MHSCSNVHVMQPWQVMHTQQSYRGAGQISGIGHDAPLSGGIAN